MITTQTLGAVRDRRPQQLGARASRSARRVAARVTLCSIAAALIVMSAAACSVVQSAPPATATPPAPPTSTLTPSVTPTATATPTPTFPRDAIVLPPSLNLRAGPNTLHPVVDVLRAGTPVAVSGRAHDGHWLAVRSVDDTRGWINAGYVDLLKPLAEIPTQPTPTSPPTPTPTPVPIDPSQPLVLAPPAVAPGDPVLVRLRYPAASQVLAAMGDTSISLQQVGPETWAGLFGVPVDTNPGEHAVHVTAIDVNGEVVLQPFQLLVHHADFDDETITLQEDAQGLLDVEVSEAERARLRDEVWSVITADRMWSGAWTQPVTGSISSRFGARRIYEGSDVTSRHEGVDFRGRAGTPVHAPARGRVEFAEHLDVRGNTVWLDHGWGVHSGYFHMTDIAVEPGDIAERGQLLGTMGATGRVTGPHLHWEVRVHGVPVQPLQWVLSDPGAVP